MKVLTYNVHGWQMPAGGANIALVAEVIEAAAPDVVGLNEVFHSAGANPRPALDVLAARLHMHYAFGATQPTDPGRHPPYGNALLSRWPILAHAAHHLTPVVDYGQRGMLECRIQRPTGDMLTIYVTHLDHRREDIRLEQWSAANTWLLRDRNRPHLLMGDFNALAATDYPDAAALARLAAYQEERGWPVPRFDLVGQVTKAGYLDAFAAGHGPASGATLPAVTPERRIDYIFLPAFLREALRSCAPFLNAAAAVASDHLPVLADIAL